jgi:hypothetical protein
MRSSTQHMHRHTNPNEDGWEGHSVLHDGHAMVDSNLKVWDGICRRCCHCARHAEYTRAASFHSSASLVWPGHTAEARSTCNVLVLVLMSIQITRQPKLVAQRPTNVHRTIPDCPLDSIEETAIRNMFHELVVDEFQSVL